MNYIAEIKAFYDLVQVKQLSQGQINLWHALMYINNKCAWIEWFSVPNITLELNTGLSRSGIAKARNALKQYGLIDFKSNGTKATSYKMLTMLKSTQDSKQNSVQGSVQDSTQDSTQDSGSLNKRNEINNIYFNLIKRAKEKMATDSFAEKVIACKWIKEQEEWKYVPDEYKNRLICDL